MKVAILTDTFLPQINGVTKTLSRMKVYMDSNGIDYRFFTPRVDDYREDKVITLASIPFFVYPECRMTISGYVRLKEELDDFKPDIIHLVTPFSIGLMGLHYGKEKNIPLVSSYHTDFPRYLKYYNISFLESTAWKFINWFHQHCEINFCPSLATKRDLENHGVKNVEIWGRGIDGDRFSPRYRSSDLRNELCDVEDQVLLYVGRVAQEKELDVLLDACKLLNSKGRKYKMIVVGDGPIKEDYEGMHIENISFVGYKSGEELSKYYATSDIFVFPSSSETYGNVILESMASGLPVIAPMSGGIVENLINGYNGLAFNVGDSSDLAEKIEYLIHDEEARMTMGRNGRQYTMIKGWNGIFKGLFTRYGQLVDKKIVRNISA